MRRPDKGGKKQKVFVDVLGAIALGHAFGRQMATVKDKQRLDVVRLKKPHALHTERYVRLSEFIIVGKIDIVVVISLGCQRHG